MNAKTLFQLLGVGIRFLTKTIEKSVIEYLGRYTYRWPFQTVEY